MARLANRAAVDLAPFAVHPFAVSPARPARGEASREPKNATLSVVSRSLRTVQIPLTRRADSIVPRFRKLMSNLLIRHTILKTGVVVLPVRSRFSLFLYFHEFGFRGARSPSCRVRPSPLENPRRAVGDVLTARRRSRCIAE